MSLIIDAPTSNPVKPLARIESFPDHIVIKPQLIGLTPFKRPAHENLGLRKGRAPRRHVTFQNVFRRYTLRTWLGDLTQDQELKDSVIHNGQQLVVQAVGFDSDDEDLTSGEEGTAHED